MNMLKIVVKSKSSKNGDTDIIGSPKTRIVFHCIKYYFFFMYIMNLNVCFFSFSYSVIDIWWQNSFMKCSVLRNKILKNVTNLKVSSRFYYYFDWCEISDHNLENTRAMFFIDLKSAELYKTRKHIVWIR